MPNETPIFTALAAAMADMDNPIKSKAVQAGARRYNYEVLADVLDIVKPALFAHGLCLKQGISMEDGQTVMRTGVGYGDAVYILDTLPVTIPADPQAAGSAITYARRYGLKTAFGLAGVDDDGEAAHQMATRSPESRSKAPSSPKPTNEPYARGFKEMKALLDKCRQAGMDMQFVGGIITDATNKKSTEFGPADYAKACGILEDMLKEDGNAHA